ncbi:sugar nucleotide-binding protein [Leptospira interrogans]|uniref:dTDP-4-dehydrorhamnose reductase n=1 Tax=Leptospira interrogans serovar Canicola TaxID=211880 RepID=D4HSG2_LEPIR|nr:sugar nucleotide-binding protein [Leptospira interrogans]ADC93845.1 dTDP-4-dehydrorhamnose reductase [Leptospira interrogans serovar Canicola]MCH5433772.1 sugar nucleotide-binding protein [Leptospira interrogans serovar Canicola]MCR8627837.1 RmlD substrate-binding protein [Leptospira interrogans serovar Canicola]OLZ30626.1 RmlD substrate-binding protein [Leptospira interrogans serovar Canicola]POR19393.1 RmlD substrate-binding protein [Leptospira interrogans serovar Canicola]
MKKILIIGGKSSIGVALENYFCKDYFVVCSSRSKEKKYYYLDLAEDLDSWEISENFDYVFFCAGISSVKICKENPILTYKVNVEHTVALIKKLIKSGSKIIFFSTSLVFNGLHPNPKEKDIVSPICEYGRLKSETEKKILNLSDNVSIIRMTKVIHKGMPLFDKWKNQLLRNEKVHAFSNYSISPISIKYLNDAMAQLLKNWTPGILHLSSFDEITYFEVAKCVAKYFGFKEDLIVAQLAKADDISMDYVPMNVALDMNYTANALNITIPSFFDALSFYNGLG